MKKKFFSSLLCIVLFFTLAACSFSRQSSGVSKETKEDPIDTTKEDTPQDSTRIDSKDPGQEQADDKTGENKKTVAIFMPNDEERWTADAAVMEQGFEELGYRAFVQYAENDPKLQAEQMEEAAGTGADCMIAAAVDSGELLKAEEVIKKAGIPLIAYDRLLLDTDAVSYYVTFDQKGTGNLIGTAIIEQAGLERLDEGEYKTIEFFMGQPDDDSALRLYNGLMEALQPYLDDGRLVCKSKHISFENTCLSKADAETAGQQCADYLDQYYENEDLDICVSAYDSLSYGCRAAIIAAGYTEDNWPVISGQGCELLACKNILEGTQAFSVFKDTGVLAAACVSLAEAAVNEMPPQINDTEQYDNNVFTVPAYACMPQIIEQDNLEEILVDGGYYTKDQLLEEE